MGLPTLKFCAIAAAGLCLFASGGWAADQAIDYSKGVGGFPRFWRPYQLPKVPPPNLANGRRLLQLIHDGKLELTLSRVNTLVEENSLDLVSARYNVDIAQTDILRAKSGQAARGAPGVSLPGEIFSSLVGAGVGAASTFNTGGTGPTAITAAARQVVVGPRGTFDPDIQIGASFDRATSPLNTSIVAGLSDVVTPSTDLTTRIEKAFETGTSVSVSFNSQRQSSTQQFLLFNPAYTSRLSVVLYQPLWNGAGLDINRRFIKIAQTDVKISRQLFRQQVSTDLVNAQNAYWDLVAAQQSVRASERALAAAQRLLADNQQQERFGALAPLDVTTAASALAGSRRDLIVAQTNEKIKELQLKALISKNVTALNDVDLITTDPLPQPKDQDIPALQDAVTTATANRSELQQADLNMANQQLVVKVTANGLKPTLGIYGFYASSSLTTGIGPLMSQVWYSIPYPEFAIGMSISFPFKNRSAQADYTRATLELHQQKTARVQTENQVGLDVRNALLTLTQNKAQVEAADLAVQSSQSSYEDEQQKLQAGASTPYRVIQLQRDLVAAQYQQIQAQANYAKAQVQLDKARGIMLQQNHIELDDVLHFN